MSQQQDQQQQPQTPNLQALYANLAQGFQKLLRDYSRERQRMRGITNPTAETSLVEAEGTLGSLGEENVALNLGLMQYLGMVLGALNDRFHTIESAMAEIEAEGGGGDIAAPLSDDEATLILELSALAEGLAKQNLEASPGATAEAKAALNHIIDVAKKVHVIAIDASEIEDGDEEDPNADSNGASAN